MPEEAHSADKKKNRVRCDGAGNDWRQEIGESHFEGTRRKKRASLRKRTELIARLFSRQTKSYSHFQFSVAVGSMEAIEAFFGYL